MRYIAAILLTSTIASAANAQALIRPKTVGIQAHVTVTKPEQASDVRIAALKLPQGFHIAKWAEGLGKPRVIAVAPNSEVYVSDRENGTITLLRGIETATFKAEVLTGKKNVHGLAIRDGKLFYAATTETFSAPINSDGTLALRRDRGRAARCRSAQ